MTDDVTRILSTQELAAQAKLLSEMWRRSEIRLD
jgi:hypothetical protein